MIKTLKAREILDSRGNPTIEVGLETDLGVFRASVPSGASTGKHEAVELRDGGERYFGKGVLKAVKNINKIIAPEIKGKNPSSQKEIDNLLIKLDGTEQKSKLGGNAICAVSLAVCKAGAAARKLELFEYIRNIVQMKYKIENAKYKIPKACFNLINGGLHAGNSLDIQEFMVVPQDNSFSEDLRMASEIYHQLKDTLSKRYGGQAVNLGDEGGFAPPFSVPKQALDIILESAKVLKCKEKIKIILDVAASHFFEEGRYKMNLGLFTREGLKRLYLELILNYPILGFEDPFSEDDWEGFSEMTREFGKKVFNSKNQGSAKGKVLIIGDDLLATNPKRIKMAKKKEAVNAMILKINQIGTVSEALTSAKLARDFDWKIIVSHRSGETNDDFIADFAVGIGADFIKTGAPARGERVAKYNRLLRIEEKL